MDVDDDLEALKAAAARTDFADSEAVARLVVRSMPVVFPECVDAGGAGCMPGAIVESLAYHFLVDKRRVRLGLWRAVRSGRLVRVGENAPIILKLAPGRSAAE